MGGEPAELRRKAALDIRVGLAQGLHREGYRVELILKLGVFVLHSPELRAQHKRIAHCGKSAPYLGDPRRQRFTAALRGRKLAAESGCLAVPAAEIKLGESSALGLLLMPPHFFKAPGSGLFLRFGLPEAFIKLKIFRFAGFYIVFVFRLVF